MVAKPTIQGINPGEPIQAGIDVTMTININLVPSADSAEIAGILTITNSSLFSFHDNSYTVHIDSDTVEGGGEVTVAFNIKKKTSQPNLSVALKVETWVSDDPYKPIQIDNASYQVS